MKKFLISILVLFAMTACTDYKVKVESDTSWSGAFGNRTVDGSGNRTVDLDDDGETVCCVVQKQTREGYLKITIIDDGSSIFASDGKSVRTTAEYGVVSVCTP